MAGSWRVEVNRDRQAVMKSVCKMEASTTPPLACLEVCTGAIVRANAFVCAQGIPVHQKIFPARWLPLKVFIPEE